VCTFIIGRKYTNRGGGLLYRRAGLFLPERWPYFAVFVVLSDRNTQLSAEESAMIYEIVHRRYKNASTIYCSQFAPAGWHQRIAEATLADAIVDRIVYDSYPIEIKSLGDTPSMREKYGLHD